MKDISKVLENKNSELEMLDGDISSLEKQAAELKEVVEKYRELKEKSKELKKVRAQKRRDMQVVLNFLLAADESYANKYYPLFADYNAGLSSAKEPVNGGLNVS